MKRLWWKRSSETARQSSAIQSEKDCVRAYHIQIPGPNEASRFQSLGVEIIVVREKLVITDGRAPTIRRDIRPEQIHRDIYRVLRVRERILSQIMRWTKIVTECARQPASIKIDSEKRGSWVSGRAKRDGLGVPGRNVVYGHRQGKPDISGPSIKQIT